MAKVEFKKMPVIKNATILCGWIDTPEHPGYPPARKPTGATIAQVARYNTKYRDFPVPFAGLIKSRLVEAIKKDVQAAMRVKTFVGTATKELMLASLIEVIKEGNWQANTPAWAAFKEKHNLSPDPLIASQVMLDSIRAEVV